MQVKNKPNSKNDDQSDSEEYIVEKIVSKKIINGRELYEIKWVGWPSRYNTHEPIEHLTQTSVQEMVAIFNSKYDINYGKSNSQKSKPNFIANSSSSNKKNDNCELR